MKGHAAEDGCLARRKIECVCVYVQGFLFVCFVLLTDMAGIQSKSVSLVCRQELIPFFSSE